MNRTIYKRASSLLRESNGNLSRVSRLTDDGEVYLMAVHLKICSGVQDSLVRRRVRTLNKCKSNRSYALMFEMFNVFAF